MKNIFNKNFLLLAGFSLFLFSCQKQEITIPQEVAKFNIATPSAAFSILNANSEFKLPIGITTVSDRDRVVKINITSRTAQQGREYFLNKTGTDIVIPAGAVLDSLVFRGDPSFYGGARKDTLRISIVGGGDVNPARFDSTFQLILRGACLEEDISLPDLAGDYNNTFEGTYGPYPSVISNVNVTSATTGTARLDNIYDSGIPAILTFDWSNPAQYTVSIAPQATGFTVGGQPLSIRSTANTVSTFRYCNTRIFLFIDLYTPNGIFDQFTMEIRR